MKYWIWARGGKFLAICTERNFYWLKMQYNFQLQLCNGSNLMGENQLSSIDSLLRLSQLGHSEEVVNKKKCLKYSTLMSMCLDDRLLGNIFIWNGIQHRKEVFNGKKLVTVATRWSLVIQSHLNAMCPGWNSHEKFFFFPVIKMLCILEVATLTLMNWQKAKVSSRVVIGNVELKFYLKENSCHARLSNNV